MFETPHLKCCKYICETIGHLDNYRVIILQHLLDDTLEFVSYLSKIAKVDIVIGKEYSNNQYVVERLKINGFNVKTPTYKDLEKEKHLEWILDSLKESQTSGDKLVLLDIGGYFAPIIKKIPTYLQKNLAGIVEDTTFGLNIYRKLEQNGELNFPVFQVARSKLKEIEAIHVGDAVVVALDKILREKGYYFSGKNVLVVGYGMIGESIADFLPSKKAHVLVYDVSKIKLLLAFMRGFRVDLTKENSIAYADIIICATGSNCIRGDDFDLMKDGVILVSAGSKDTEIDVEVLKKRSNTHKRVSEHIEKYVLDNGKIIYLLNKGRAINFIIGSIPSKITDLVFSEIIMCNRELSLKNYKPGIYTLENEKIEEIANIFLQTYTS